MNAEKLKRLQTQVRIGGKGTPRRKKKVIHQTTTTDDKKLQSSLKKLSVSTIPGIEEVNIIKDDLTVIHFNNPKAQASLSANTFAVTGHGETKKVVEMLPEILPQLGQETVVQLRMFANSMTGTTKKASAGVVGVGSGSDAGDAGMSGANMLYSVEEEDDVPMLVSDFDEVAKVEATAAVPAKATTPIATASNAEKTVNENITVLPTAVQHEVSNTTMIDNAVKKESSLQSLENLNLNIKSNDATGLQSTNKKSNNENIKQQTKETPANKGEKEKASKDVKKSNEMQKKNENKTKQKQEHQPATQQTKSEPKSSKGVKENVKPEEIVSKRADEKNVQIEASAEKMEQAALQERKIEKEQQDKQQQKSLQEKQQQKGQEEKQQQKAPQDKQKQKVSQEKQEQKGQQEKQQLKTSPGTQEENAAQDKQQQKVPHEKQQQKAPQEKKQEKQQQKAPQEKSKEKMPQEKQQPKAPQETQQQKVPQEKQQQKAPQEKEPQEKQQQKTPQEKQQQPKASQDKQQHNLVHEKQQEQKQVEQGKSEKKLEVTITPEQQKPGDAKQKKDMAPDEKHEHLSANTQQQEVSKQQKAEKKTDDQQKVQPNNKLTQQQQQNTEGQGKQKSKQEQQKHDVQPKSAREDGVKQPAVQNMEPKNTDISKVLTAEVKSAAKEITSDKQLNIEPKDLKVMKEIVTALPDVAAKELQKEQQKSDQQLKQQQTQQQVSQQKQQGKQQKQNEQKQTQQPQKQKQEQHSQQQKREQHQVKSTDTKPQAINKAVDGKVIQPATIPKTEPSAVADLSIKTVALQSLQSSEKIMGMVNELTRELPIENLKKQIDNGREITKDAALVTQQLPLLTTSQQPPKKVEENEQEQKITQSQLLEAKLKDVEDLLSAVVGPADRDEKTNIVIVDSEKAKPAEGVTEQQSKAPCLALMLQAQPTTSPMTQTTVVQQLDRAASSTEMAQAQPALPFTPPKTPQAENIKSVAQPANKQLTMAEILQGQTAESQLAAAISLPQIPQTEVATPLISGPVGEAQNLPVNPQVNAPIATATPNSCANSAAQEKIAEHEATSSKTASPKQKTTPPKQLPSEKATLDGTKQQNKSTSGAEAVKAPTKRDAELKLTTKQQQTGQQQQTKAKSNPASIKSSPTTPTTPTTPTRKLSPEKLSSPTQKPTTSTAKAGVSTAIKKANSPQKQQQQQVDALTKTPSPKPSVGGKNAHPVGSNATPTTESSKKSNPPPAGGKPNANAGGKHKEGTSPKSPTVATSAKSANISAAMPPTTENTSTATNIAANQPSIPKQ